MQYQNKMMTTKDCITSEVDVDGLIRYIRELLAQPEYTCKHCKKKADECGCDRFQEKKL